MNPSTDKCVCGHGKEAHTYYTQSDARGLCGMCECQMFQTTANDDVRDSDKARRDEFAKAAIAGAAVSDVDAQKAAHWAVQCADALIAELDK